MESFDAVALVEDCTEDLCAPTCPLCSEPLLILSGLVRCPRCGLMLCDSCEGVSGS